MATPELTAATVLTKAVNGPLPTPVSRQMQPPATLLMGSSGAGKTTAIATYLKSDIETFVLTTEPGGVESLLDGCELHKVSVDKLHWASVLPVTSGWKGLLDMTEKVSALSFSAVSDLKNGIGKDQTRSAAMKFLNTLANFTCERTGQSYGDVTEWGPDRAFVIDSLSGWSVISWALTVGHKPTAHQGEWNIAMNWIHDVLLKVTSDRKCFFTLTSHIEKETNEITGAMQVMTSTLGRKLAPKIPKFFSEVVLAARSKDRKFNWSTIDNNAELKNRALPVSDNLPPDFTPIVEAYRRRVKLASS